MQREEALALVRTLIDAAYRRDLSQLTQCYADDAVAVSPVFGQVSGRRQIAATWEKLFATFADFTVDVSDVLVDGDRVAVLSTVKTTDRVGWFGLPPTGSAIGYRLVLLFTVVQGRIVRDERIYDSAGVLERLEKARLDHELRTAAEVQRSLMARTSHDRSFCQSAGSSLPCRAIGGDFFEFVDLPSEAVGVVMGDVSGKGPAAALLASMLQGIFAAQTLSVTEPAAVLARMNELIVRRQVESRFATLVYAVLSLDGRLRYSNAGHNPPVLATRSGLRRLDAGGSILGAFGGASFEQAEIRMEEGDTLVMFTDGVTEARNATDEEFGEQRLIVLIESRRHLLPVDLMTELLTSVRSFCNGVDQSDDITVTVTRFGRRCADAV